MARTSVDIRRRGMPVTDRRLASIALAGHIQQRRRGAWRMEGPTIGAMLLEMVESKTCHDERQADATAKVNDLLSTLDERSRIVIKMRWGIGGELPKTQAEVAERLNVNQATVSRVERLALAKLRNAA
jgi:RNA polymerase sigma factor (sigma-70 family)